MCHSDVGNKPLSEEKEEFQTLSDIRVYIFTPTNQDDSQQGGPLKIHPNCLLRSTLSLKDTLPLRNCFPMHIAWECDFQTLREV